MNQTTDYNEVTRVCDVIAVSVLFYCRILHEYKLCMVVHACRYMLVADLDIFRRLQLETSSAACLCTADCAPLLDYVIQVVYSLYQFHLCLPEEIRRSIVTVLYLLISSNVWTSFSFQLRRVC